MQKRLSWVIVGTIFISFMLLLVIYILSMRSFWIKGAEEKAAVIAELVQDGLSAHMLSGTMDQREFFLNKIASAKGIDSLWIVRSPSVIEQFGKGFNNETPRDEIDHEVLKTSTSYKKVIESSQSAKLRVSAPYVAKEHATPNCMACHNAKEGEVLGLVSMVFDIAEIRTDGIITSLVVLGFSLIIMLFVFMSINHSMKPLMALFDSINYVMNKAQMGDYTRRVRVEGKNKDCENVALWINSLLAKLESSLMDIETTIRKFLFVAPSHQHDPLLEAQTIVHELSDIYQFKRTIEFDESKEDVYNRMGTILMDTFELKDFALIESGKHAISPRIVFDAMQTQKSPHATCRALRTKQSVYSDQFKHICETCAHVAPHYVCIPYVISDEFELLLSATASSKEELERIKEKLPLIQNYIDGARPELVSKDLMQILKISSTTDALTGLYNRKYLDEYIEKALAQAKRNGIVYGVLMIDIDYFKMVNDTYGHDVGDKAIKALSKILQESIREADTAFRFGGEEFLVLLYQCEKSMIESIAHKIRIKFEKTPIQANNGNSFYKTLSVGVSIFPNHSDSIWKCIKFADIALYNAKEQGRNCVKIFDETMLEGKEMKSDY
ncbi:GGDEF domain-containing protein [Sulfurospirillum barnesii]|uniref:diguanylate cyclase n=1 Tax=Sulfurospirillum barnesii (strain ATCC 700032 / DSM 10660 / SES-3) TaxID=760154 RepID=I3XYM4_SULBS|nr:GGDEF domain-containing protein [Sulfurospirillum barnesii]AFL69048.1 diguanylate cyclase (GGDEF) domain-containing protein [Sulfurospirillum barnesii SES-3]